MYAHDGLLPLVNKIEKHLSGGNVSGDARGNDFSATIMPKYQKKLRKSCLALRKCAVLLAKPRKKPLLERMGNAVGRISLRNQRSIKQNPDRSRLASVVLAVTFQRLLDGKLDVWSYENDLVLEALRRSTGRLEDASFTELSAYIKELSPEQLQGVISNTKGIYHELLFAEMHNISGAETVAAVMNTTNYPGADVQFILDNHVVREVQLKAVSSPSLVYEHLERYPDIEILVTEETAAMLDGINSSGLSNAVLSREVAERMEVLKGDGVIEAFSDALITSVFVTSGFAIWSILVKHNKPAFDLKPYLSNAGIALGTATAVESAVALAGG